MTSTLYCTIQRGTGSTTDYGPAGNNSLTSLSVEPSGPGAIGTATISLNDIAVGFDIRTRDYVKIYESSDGGTTIDDRIFIGFVEDRQREIVPGTVLVKWTIKCQDANVLEDWLRQQAVTLLGISDGGVTRIDQQIQRITRAVTTNNVAGSCTFDDTSGIALTSVLTTDITFSYQQLSLRDMIDKRLKAYQSSYTSQRPKHFMGFTTTGGAVGFVPQLNVYDEAALLASAAKWTFSTGTAGGLKSVMTLREIRQGGNLVTSQQAIAFTSGSLVRQRANSSNRSTYPNAFDQRPIGPASAALTAWDGPLIKMPDGSTSAQVAAAAAQEIAASENPAETFEITTQDTFATGILPGDTIAITSTELGLSGYKRVVAKVTIQYLFLGGGTYLKQRTVTAGNQLLELGDGSKRQTSPVLEGDTTHPQPPTSLAASVLTGEGEIDIFLDWTLSVSADVVRQYVHYRINSGGEYIVPIGATDVQFTVVIPYSLTYSVWLTAMDGAGNESDSSNVISQTAPGPVPPPTLLNPDFIIQSLADATQPRYWSKTTFSGGTAVLDTTKAVKGGYTYHLHLTTNPASQVTVQGYYIGIINTSADSVSSTSSVTWRVAYQSLVATGTLKVQIKYYSAYTPTPVQVGSTVTVKTVALTVGQKVYGGSDTPPGGAIFAAIFVDLTGTGTAQDVYISGCKLENAITVSSFDPGTHIFDEVNEKWLPTLPILFTQTADVTVVNDGSEVSLVGTGVGTTTLPANCLVPGRSIRIKGAGYFTTVGAAERATLFIALNSAYAIGTDRGGSVSHDMELTSTSQPTMFNFEVLLTCRTDGVSGTLVGQGVFWWKDDTNAVSNVVYGNDMIMPVGVSFGGWDSTVTNVIDTLWGWRSADPANSATLTNLTYELIN